MDDSYYIKILKFVAASWIKITQPSEQIKKEVNCINGVFASATFVDVKVVGQEQKWVGWTDSDEVKCQHGRVWQSIGHGNHYAWTDFHVTDEECVHFDKD